MFEDLTLYYIFGVILIFYVIVSVIITQSYRKPCPQQSFDSLLINHHCYHNLFDQLKELTEQLETSRIEYFLCSASLLGFARYQDLLPWRNRLEIGIFDSQGFELLAQNNHWPIKKTSYGYQWKEIRIYLHTGKERRNIVPLRKVRFGLLSVFVPKHTEDYLNHKYKNWKKQVIIEPEKRLPRWNKIKVTPEFNHRISNHLDGIRR